MAKFDSALAHVKIATPCSADWDEMFSFEGERVRFCSQCNLNVYNLSAMTPSEATTLIYRTEGRLCVRFYRRPDGTILTQNCPVGLRALKRRALWMAQVLLGMLLGTLADFGLARLVPVGGDSGLSRLVRFGKPKAEPLGFVVMGGMRPLPIQPAPKKDHCCEEDTR